MKNLFKLFWIIVLVTVIGFSFVSCDSGGGGGGGGGGSEPTPVIPGLSKNNPSQAQLESVGITLAQFNEIKNAIPEYQGYITGSLFLYWINRNKADFDKLVTKVEEVLETKLDIDEDEYWFSAIGKHDDDKWIYITLFKKESFLDAEGTVKGPEKLMQLIMY